MSDDSSELLLLSVLLSDSLTLSGVSDDELSEVVDVLLSEDSVLSLELSVLSDELLSEMSEEVFVFVSDPGAGSGWRSAQPVISNAAASKKAMVVLCSFVILMFLPKS